MNDEEEEEREERQPVHADVTKFEDEAAICGFVVPLSAASSFLKGGLVFLSLLANTHLEKQKGRTDQWRSTVDLKFKLWLSDLQESENFCILDACW